MLFGMKQKTLALVCFFAMKIYVSDAENEKLSTIHEIG